MSNDKLTYKQKIFCENYIVDWNATQAAINAGYSENSAKEIGCENLTKPNIKEYIESIQNDLEKTAGISRLRVLKEYMAIGFEDNPKWHPYKLKALDSICKMLGYDIPIKSNNENKTYKLNFSFGDSELDELTKQNKDGKDSI